MVLGDVGEAIKRGEEEEALDAVGVCGGGGGSDAGADGFAEDDDGN